jgi:tRNA G18 (ribose-2'-O)-methylase SpoU
VPDILLDYADHVLHIPMHGQKESLNVSIAAAIAMYSVGGG